MQIDRLSLLLAQCAALRAAAGARGDAVAFSHFDRAALRLDAALFETRRGRHDSARAFAWSACDLLSLIYV
jgi:hypothetical protein